MADPVDEARRLLAAATRGPWRADSEGCVISDDPDDEDYDTQIAGVHDSEFVGRPNAALIASAPTLLAALCDEVERLRAVRDAADALDEALGEARLAMAIDGHMTVPDVAGWLDELAASDRNEHARAVNSALAEAFRKLDDLRAALAKEGV